MLKRKGYGILLGILLLTIPLCPGNAARAIASRGFLLIYSNDVHGEIEPCG